MRSLVPIFFFAAASCHCQTTYMLTDSAGMKQVTIHKKDLRADSVLVERNRLLNFCGDYMDSRLIALSIFFENGSIYRRMYNGVRQERLIPFSSNQFVYADGSGRTMEFFSGKNGEVLYLTIAAKEGPFTYDRIK